MSGSLFVSNCQRARKVEMRAIRGLARSLLEELLGRTEYELGFIFVGAEEMARMNEEFLNHEGATDVLTFNYAEEGRRATLAGEVFICVDEAVAQARRFRTTWQSELVRYLVHGVLHLCGYDDHRAVQRRKMKQAEDRLVKELSRQRDFTLLGGKG